MGKKRVTTKKIAITARKDSKGGNGKQGRSDGWENALTGLGTSKDKRRATKFAKGKKIGDDQLSAIYRGNGFGRRIIDLIPNDMTRNWLKITNDEDDQIKQKLEALGAQAKMNHAMKMARLYGGAIVIMGINDGQDLKEPVKSEKVKSVDYLTVFDRRDVTIEPDQIESDIKTGRWGQPKQYEVQARFGSETFKVHASRVIQFDGAELAWREYEANSYWMDSVLEAVYEHIRQLGAVYDSAEFIVEAFVQTVIKIKNLLAMIASGNEALLKKRLNWLNMTRHIANTELMDAEEDYQKHSSTVAGLSEVIDRFMMGVSAATGIPVTLLMGRSPAGQNATGDADLTFYYDNVRAWQRNEFGPAIEPLIEYIIGSDDIKPKPEQWSIEFNPLHEPTSKEQAELYKLTAEGDQLYIMNQVIDPEVIGRHRFVGDHFNAEPPSMSEEDFFIEEEEPEPAVVVPPPPAVPPGTQPVPPQQQPPAPDVQE